MAAAYGGVSNNHQSMAESGIKESWRKRRNQLFAAYGYLGGGVNGQRKSASR